MKSFASEFSRRTEYNCQEELHVSYSLQILRFCESNMAHS